MKTTLDAIIFDQIKRNAIVSKDSSLWNLEYHFGMNFSPLSVSDHELIEESEFFTENFFPSSIVPLYEDKDLCAYCFKDAEGNKLLSNSIVYAFKTVLLNKIYTAFVYELHDIDINNRKTITDTYFTFVEGDHVRRIAGGFLYAIDAVHEAGGEKYSWTVRYQQDVKKGDTLLVDTCNGQKIVTAVSDMYKLSPLSRIPNKSVIRGVNAKVIADKSGEFTFGYTDAPSKVISKSFRKILAEESEIYVKVRGVNATFSVKYNQDGAVKIRCKNSEHPACKAIHNYFNGAKMRSIINRTRAAIGRPKMPKISK